MAGSEVLELAQLPAQSSALLAEVARCQPPRAAHPWKALPAPSTTGSRKWS